MRTAPKHWLGPHAGCEPGAGRLLCAVFPGGRSQGAADSGACDADLPGQWLAPPPSIALVRPPASPPPRTPALPVPTTLGRDQGLVPGPLPGRGCCREQPASSGWDLPGGLESGFGTGSPSHWAACGAPGAARGPGPGRPSSQHARPVAGVRPPRAGPALSPGGRGRFPGPSQGRRRPSGLWGSRQGSGGHRTWRESGPVSRDTWPPPPAGDEAARVLGRCKCPPVTPPPHTRSALASDSWAAGEVSRWLPALHLSLGASWVLYGDRHLGSRLGRLWLQGGHPEPCEDRWGAAAPLLGSQRDSLKQTRPSWRFSCQARLLSEPLEPSAAPAPGVPVPSVGPHPDAPRPLGKSSKATGGDREEPSDVT